MKISCLLFAPIIFLVFTLLGCNLHGQVDTWVPVNNGLPQPTNGQTISFIQSAGGETYLGLEDGLQKFVYKYNKTINAWEKFSEPPSQYGFGNVKTSGSRIFSQLSDNTLVELNTTAKRWDKVVDGSNLRVTVFNWSAYADKIYSLEGDPDKGFYVKVFSHVTKSYQYLGKPKETETYPLPPENINRIHNVIGLNNGKVYVGYRAKFRDNPSAFSAVYEWNGTRWISVSGGLNFTNTIGSGLGFLEGIFASTDGNELYVRTELAYYKKNRESGNGWFELGSRSYKDAAPSYAAGNYLLGLSKGKVFMYDKNVTTPLGNSFPADVYLCDNADNVKHLSSPDDGNTFFVHVCVEKGINCAPIEPSTNLGIYKLVASTNKLGTVRNLHIETSTYLGNDVSVASQNKSAGVVIGSSKVYVSGVFTSNMNSDNLIIIKSPGRANSITSASPGKIFSLSLSGKSVDKVAVVGNAVYDMAIENVDGKERIALIGDFGVLVVDRDLNYLWHSDVSTNTSSRISIAANGKVAAITKTEVAVGAAGAGVIRLWSKAGVLEGSNFDLDKNGRTLTDIEISSAVAHNKIYVSGFVQVSSVLQVANIFAFDINNVNSFRFKTWGFGASEVDTKIYPADTRIYRLRTNKQYLFALGESAGGGPGGATILAFNGKDLTTKIAHTDNDTYTDGTNSCGPCHITFVSKIDPANGTALNGKFIHPRQINGKTNTQTTSNSALDVDEDGNMYIGAVSASYIQARNSLNVNGQLVGTYVGDDMVFLMLSADFKTRIAWTPFSKSGAGGIPAGISVGNGKVAYVGTTLKGTMFTFNAFRTNSSNNSSNSSNKVTDSYLAIFDKNVWSTSNLDPPTYPLVFSGNEDPNSSDQDIKIIPNPANDEVSISYSLGTQETSVGVLLTDLSGKIILEKSIGVLANNLTATISIGQIASGVYIVTILKNGKRAASARLLKK